MRKMADQTAKAAAREVEFSRRSLIESEANTNLQREVELVKTSFAALLLKCFKVGHVVRSDFAIKKADALRSGERSASAMADESKRPNGLWFAPSATAPDGKR